MQLLQLLQLQNECAGCAKRDRFLFGPGQCWQIRWAFRRTRGRSQPRACLSPPGWSAPSRTKRTKQAPFKSNCGRRLGELDALLWTQPAEDLPGSITHPRTELQIPRKLSAAERLDLGAFNMCPACTCITTSGGRGGTWWGQRQGNSQGKSGSVSGCNCREGGQHGLQPQPSKATQK